ncbi:MAG: NAD-dependent epimerase/dehydratase family protein [Pseudomonadota bacterium]
MSVGRGTALVTGAAGFVGHALSLRLIDEGWTVIGFDAVTDYYDPALKRARLARLHNRSEFSLVEERLETPEALAALFEEHKPELVVHLAAQAGVRYSIDAPESYVEANLIGTFRLLEAARAHPPEHMMMASTSSVYGANTEMPYAETHKADSQMSFYAATKKANEAMAHSYAHLYHLPVTMFRFFTVYGPWGRPDMALFKFTKAALSDAPIDVYNEGKMRRDFTYIDDLVHGLTKLADVPPARPECAVPDGDSLSSVAPFRVINLGNAEPVGLMTFIEAIEAATGRQIEKRMMPMQPGDVPATWADTALAEQLIGPLPTTPIAEGVQRFVDWYRDHYAV